MKMTADVVIVGGGVMGVSIAYHLAARGVADVLMLEKRFVGAGASGKSGAIVRQHYSHEVTASMALRGLRFFERFEETTGCDAGFSQVGFLMVVPDAERESLQHNVDLQRRVGVDTRVLGAGALADLDSRGSWGDSVAAYEPGGGWVNPLYVLSGFRQRAESLGARIEEGTTVHSIERDGTRVVGVRLSAPGEGPGDVIATDSVILAAGSWSHLIARRSGFDLPIEVIRPEIAFIARQADFGRPHPVVGDLANGIYFRPDHPDRTLIGTLDNSQDERVVNPDDYNESASHAFVKSAHTAVARRYPALSRGVRRGGYAGLYACTPDSQPIIDTLPDLDGLLVVTGFSGHGFKLSPAVGEAVAELLVSGKQKPAGWGMFGADRFSENRVATNRFGYGVLS